MSETQSIIVYRNPLEKAIWEGDINILPIIVWMVATVVLTVLIHSIIDSRWFRAKISKKIQNNSVVSPIIFAVSSICSFFIAKNFMI